MDIFITINCDERVRLPYTSKFYILIQIHRNNMTARQSLVKCRISEESCAVESLPGGKWRSEEVIVRTL